MSQADPPAEPFVVNFDDPSDIRAKLAYAREQARIRIEQLEAVRHIEAELSMWNTRVNFLEVQLPAADREAEAEEQVTTPVVASNGGGADVSVTDLVVDVVNREVRKIRARDVGTVLAREGYNFGRVTISNALHYAAHKAGRIKAAEGRGMYAPLNFTEPQTPLGQPAEGARPG